MGKCAVVNAQVYGKSRLRP